MKYRQYEVHCVAGLKLDLFCTSWECWGAIFAIRTGPAEFSKRLVTTASRGGLLRDGLRVSEGRVLTEAGEPLETPSETEFLALCGGWIEPKDRQ
jgi:DNA polymerase/3'-5' exonuclease PolX